MITFNGVDLGNLIRVPYIGGRGPLAQNIIRTTVPGKNGSYPIRKTLPERSIPVEFMILGNSFEQLRQNVDTLNGILNVDFDAPITFTDEPGRVYFGQVDGEPDWEEFLKNGKGKITFLCCDPLKYSPQETNTSFANNTAYPNVSGTYKTYPRIEATFTAAATEFKITHTQQNKYVRVTRNFVAGDKLVIDFATGKITLNGNVTMPILDWVNSDFFTFQPGAQTLTVTPGTTTKIFWKSRWL
jgi:predicted phage tail component-like protein